MATLLFIINVWYETPRVTIQEFPTPEACAVAHEKLLKDLEISRASTKWTLTCVPKE